MGAPSQSNGVDLIDTFDQEPTGNALDATYTSLIQQYLSVLCVDNATFLAERFVASSKNNHSLYLLAICHYRAGSPQRAQRILSQAKSPSPAMQYLLAKCYHDMDKYVAAEDVLLNQARSQYCQSRIEDETDHPTMDEWILSTTPCPIPSGAAGLHLMAKICRNSNRKERAIHYFRMSLKLDPMMWTSYEALCELGAKDEAIDPMDIFGVQPALLEMQATKQFEEEQSTPLQGERGVLTPSFTLSQTPMEASAMRQLELGTPSTSNSSYLPMTSLFHSTGRQSTAAKRTGHRLPTQTALFETPNLTPIPMRDKSFVAAQPHSNAPPSVTTNNHTVVHRARKVASRLYYEPSPEITPPSRWEHKSTSRPRSLFLSGIDSSNATYGRRSLSTVVPEDSVLSDTSLHGDGNRSSTRDPRALFPTIEMRTQPETLDSIPQGTNVQEKERATETEQGGAQESDGTPEDGGVQEILELLCILGVAHKRLCQFRCREALEIFHQLPQKQFQTGWVLHQVGRAYFEMADYQNAQRHLLMMQQVEPHRMKGLEVLSTALWHLKKEVELSHLAQQAVDFDRLCPETWCVVGNCFSLQKEHETALTFFRRSIQLDPSFTYSHTLSGHEYVAVEDFEKAVACYRDAIRADERHYNAWYGLGAIYYRQEKYDLAEYHFHRALTINPQSSVLHCHLGMAQHANGKAYEALATLAGAFRLDPRNPQARYQRATIYMAMDRHHEALIELEKVRDAAPREASVHFAMGRVLKRIGRPEQAMRCFLTALDLDPKDTNLIKAAMDKVGEPDMDEEVSTF